MTNGSAKWGIRLEIDFGQGSFNVIAGSVNWRSRIQVEVTSRHFRVGQWACGYGFGQNRHDFVFNGCVHSAAGVAACAKDHALGTYHTTRCLQVVHTRYRCHTLYWADWVYLHDQRSLCTSGQT